MRACVQVCMRVFVCACARACMHVYVHARVCMSTCVRACACVSVSACPSTHLVTENGQALLQGQLEPIPAGDPVAGVVAAEGRAKEDRRETEVHPWLLNRLLALLNLP